MFKKYALPVLVMRSGTRLKLVPCDNIKWNKAPKGLSSLTLDGIPETAYNGQAVIGSIDLEQVVAIELKSCYRIMSLKDIIESFGGTKKETV